MRLIDHTFATEAENLALDEALLHAPDTSTTTDGSCWLRFWESPTPYVVLGRSSRVEQEVNLAACQELGIPVLRRPSGGATIVTGPGCLMYAVVLNTELPEGLLTVSSAHRYVLEKMTTALGQFNTTVSVAGTSDLVYTNSVSSNDNKPAKVWTKFSGNSVRLVRNRLLYHGTLLYDFDLPLIERLLLTPPRQPDYRQQRTHQAFVGNLQANRANLVTSISKAWNATSDADSSAPIPEATNHEVQRLVEERYGCRSWNYSR